MYTLLIKAMVHTHGQMFIQFHIKVDLLYKVYILSSIFFLVLSKNIIFSMLQFHFFDFPPNISPSHSWASSAGDDLVKDLGSQTLIKFKV